MSISHYLVISLCIHNRIWVIGWPHKVNQQLLWSWMKWGRCNLNTCKNFITGVKNNSRFAITNITTAGVNLSTILLILTTLKMLFLWNLETTAMQQSMDGGAPVVRGCDISIHIHYSQPNCCHNRRTCNGTGINNNTNNITAKQHNRTLTVGSNNSRDLQHLLLWEAIHQQVAAVSVSNMNLSNNQACRSNLVSCTVSAFKLYRPGREIPTRNDVRAINLK